MSVACRTYTSFSELKKDYEEGQLHPGDLKEGLKSSLNAILEPVRKHFDNDVTAKDLLKKVKQYRTTR
jgi:tyrosyl-tRNA synthetase